MKGVFTMKFPVRPFSMLVTGLLTVAACYAAHAAKLPPSSGGSQAAAIGGEPSSGQPMETVVIPGPLRSFLRMAGISQEATPGEVLPLLARNAFLYGHESGKRTEYLVLADRYVHLARELQALAGADGTIHVSGCADAGKLIQILGYKFEHGCSRNGRFFNHRGCGASVSHRRFRLPPHSARRSASERHSLRLCLSSYSRSHPVFREGLDSARPGQGETRSDSARLADERPKCRSPVLGHGAARPGNKTRPVPVARTEETVRLRSSCWTSTEAGYAFAPAPWLCPGEMPLNRAGRIWQEQVRKRQETLYTICWPRIRVGWRHISMLCREWAPRSKPALRRATV